MIWTICEGKLGKSVLTARHDNDDDDCTVKGILRYDVLYIYIYIYIFL